MNKMSKDKRDKLILTIIGIMGALGILYTFVLGAQNDQLNTLRTQIAATQDKVSKAERLVKSESIVQANLAESKEQLEARMQDMAPQGQYYYWFFKLLDEFRKKEALNPGFIIDITQPEFVDIGLLPKFPYRAASFGVRLSGQYQEIGRFIAALENKYPYFRVEDPVIVPQGRGGSTQNIPSGGDSSEKLVVEIRVVTPIKPGTT